MYTSFDFNPSDVLLPEAARYADDDFLLEYEERKAKRRQANWYYDEECEDWAWDGEE